ncbi:hypothetical protein MP638_001360 [Amoeboaphelidium occidentale]|nr:hypothetical protein MP638_001360 [Amoeboaphelidium occidentale]
MSLVVSLNNPEIKRKTEAEPAANDKSKGVKAEQQQQQQQQKFNYKKGDMVWAKLKGYPSWPAKILDSSNLPRDLKKRSAPLGSFPVVFYGQNDYAFVPGQSIKPFLSQLEEHLSQLKKKPVKGLKEAIALAQDAPNSVDFVYNLHEQEEQEEDRFVTQEGEIEYSKKSKSSKKRTATSAAAAAAAAAESFNEESSVASSSAAAAAAAFTSKKKKKKKLNSEALSKSESEILLGEIEYSKKSKSSKKRTATSAAAAAAAESFNDESSVASSSAAAFTSKKKKKKKLNSEALSKSESEILLGLRHKLQRIFLGDTLKTEDFGKVNDLMEEVERFNVTFDLLRDTKIGKVIKRLSSMVIENEPANVVERAAALLEKWRKLLPTTTTTTTPLGVAEQQQGQQGGTVDTPQTTETTTQNPEEGDTLPIASSREMVAEEEGTKVLKEGKEESS